MLLRLLFLCSLFPLSVMGGELKVTSYNIRQDTAGDKGDREWAKRAPGILKFLKEGEFSIIGLQEAKHNQVEGIQKGLPLFKRLGVGRADGKKGGEYAPLFYDSATWSVDEKEQGNFWLSDTPEIPGSMSWGNKVTRICTWGRFLGKDGKAFYVYNTHWDHRSEASREKSAGLILERVKARKFQQDPVILMGDFNATIESAAIKIFLNSGMFLDHGEKVQFLTFNKWVPGLKEGLRIDHILVSPSLKKAKFQALADGDPVNSDHHPVALTIATD